MSKGSGTVHGCTVEIKDKAFNVNQAALRLPDGTLVGPEWERVSFQESPNPCNGRQGYMVPLSWILQQREICRQRAEHQS